MFSQACVCPQGASASVHAGKEAPPGKDASVHAGKEASPLGRMPQCMLGRKPPPPHRRLTLRTVRILLECILVGAYKNEMSVLRSTNRPPRCRAYEIIRLGVIMLKKNFNRWKIIRIVTWKNMYQSASLWPAEHSLTGFRLPCWWQVHFYRIDLFFQSYADTFHNLPGHLYQWEDQSWPQLWLVLHRYLYRTNWIWAL